MARILLVEDKPARADAIVIALADHVVRRAATAEEAIRARPDLYDVVLLDFDLDRTGELLVEEVGTGMRIAEFVACRDRRPLVVVHSKNAGAAVGLVFYLMAHDVPVFWLPLPNDPADGPQLDFLVEILRDF